MAKKSLKKLLHSSNLEFLMEAHNGLSARIVEETGFKGIWGSGLSISAAHGVRDNNELSWTQVLETVEFMADAVDIPILLDGDTGFGNFNNMRRLVEKLEQRGVGGVCIEDKEFPKTNSFINSEQQPLADMEEFAGKISAGCHARKNDEFCIVARIEAFIAGWGLEEALIRASRYADAGADAILCHSKISTPEQVISFMDNWDRDIPVIIVPTMYYSTPVEVFENAGVSLVIWANHNLRSAITAMQETSKKIYAERSLRNVEDEIVPVREIFRLQQARELQEAEKQYLPPTRRSRSAIILAASQGDKLKKFSDLKPKTMLNIGGEPILHKLSSQLRKAGIRDINIIRGYKKEEVQVDGGKYIDIDQYEDTGELYSLYQARDMLTGELVISYGDIMFRQYILNTLLYEEGDIVITVDGNWRERPYEDRYVDFVSASSPYTLEYREEDVFLKKVDPELDETKVDGEWIGLLKTSSTGTEIVKEKLKELAAEKDIEKLRFKDLFNKLIEDGEQIKVHYISGHWLDVDEFEDISEAQKF
ncbi:MAG: phosphoenolpyruvate mutase [bacterium]